VFREQPVSCGGVLLNCASGPPSGPPLLLLHGVGRRWQDFLTLTPALAQRWQVHALDLRGHGQSARASQYRVIDYAQDVIAYLRTQVGTPAVVYGHSLGALVAAAVAAELPRLVRAVVLEDPPAPALLHNLPQTPFFAQFTGMQALAGTERPVAEVARALADLRLPGPAGTVRLGDLRDAAALRFVARCLREVDPALYTPLLQGQWLDGYDVPRVFGGIRCPVLLLRADERCGGMLRAEEADELTGLMADCLRIDLAGVGHLLHWQTPDAVLRLTVNFLESL